MYGPSIQVSYTWPPLGWSWARRSAVIVAAMIGGLSVTVPAFAATPEVRVGGHHWKIKIGGHSYTVKPGGKIVYPACDTVESITPVVKLSSKAGPRHFYAAWVVGPKATGESQQTERLFRGSSAVFEYPVVALAFPKLTRSVNVTHFVAGTYSLEMRFGSKKAKPQTVEKVTLATRAGC